jgi:hypothetical protein
MNKKLAIKKFEEFLETHRAFDEFIGEVHAQRTYLASPLEHVYKVHSHANFIRMAFTWSLSDSGFDYWDRLAIKWETSL